MLSKIYWKIDSEIQTLNLSWVLYALIPEQEMSLGIEK